MLPRRHNPARHRPDPGLRPVLVLSAVVCLGLGTAAAQTSTRSAPAAAPAPSSSSAMRAQVARVVAAAAANDSQSRFDAAPQTLGSPFATRYASFQPVPFDTMPGWNTDNLLESLNVFRRSCRVLSSKAAWADTCAALEHSDTSSSGAARQFFQTRFNAYQVRNLDENPTGLITGYYEPQLSGRRHRDAQFRFPVYARPRDLYLLDSRSVTGAPSQWLEIAGDRLQVVAAHTPGAREYRVDLGSDLPGMADKRYRVRIDGRTIRPYWTRRQIEQHGVDAKVLAWVDDAWALYSMQIQGTGRIRMADGSVIRLAYGGQNGQPFLPNASSHDTALVADAIKTRGLGSLHDRGESGSNDDVAAIIARLQGGTGATPPRPGHSGQQTATVDASPGVQKIIDTFQGHASVTSAAADPSMPPPAATTTSKKASDPQVQAMIAMLLGKTPSPTGAGAPSPTHDAHAAAPVALPTGNDSRHGAPTGISDPSYVFFREVDTATAGPPGALGVPLTPGRSLAVDPRTTPLGAPVFVETARPRADGDIQRLMLAQDTGGAIRGSVRGDFFWGAGPRAGSLASAMNAAGRMWLLLPKKLQLGALNPRVRLRSLGNRAAAPDCVIPDDESCVD